MSSLIFLQDAPSIGRKDGAEYRRISSRWFTTGISGRKAIGRSRQLIDAHRALPLATVWGAGRTSSSDGQYFRAGGTGAAILLSPTWRPSNR